MRPLWCLTLIDRWLLGLEKPTARKHSGLPRRLALTIAEHLATGKHFRDLPITRDKP
jgi:hypothetical protein